MTLTKDERELIRKVSTGLATRKWRNVKREMFAAVESILSARLDALHAELVKAINDGQGRWEQMKAERDAARAELDALRDATAKRAESAAGLLRSLSINPAIPDVLRSLMKETLND